MKGAIVLDKPKPVLVHSNRHSGSGSKVWQTMLLIAIKDNGTKAVLLIGNGYHSYQYYPIDEVFEIPVIDLIPVNLSHEPVHLDKSWD